MQEIKIVLGTLFGDEGKGTVVQWLCKNAIDEGKSVAVVRFSGGPQAAHTIVNNGVEHICSSFGSGVLLGVPTYYIYGSLFDPICAYNEWKCLKEKMDNVPLINIQSYLACITPYDVIANQQDADMLKDGTCGRGVWACRHRHESKDYFLYTYSQFLRYRHKEKQFQSVCEYYGMERQSDLEELYNEACNEKFYRVFLGNIQMSQELKGYDVLIFEGTQGLLLDAERGFFPNVSATETGYHFIEHYLNHYEFNVKPEFFLTIRTYLTRHGNGYTPKTKLKWNLSQKHETNQTNKYQGDFKTGVLESKLIEKACDRHNLANLNLIHNIDFNLVVTHMDLVAQNGFMEIEKENRLITIENDIEKVLKSIADCFEPLPFKSLYYNDSPESNIKEL